MNFGFEFAISLLEEGASPREVARMRNTVVYTGFDLLAALATSDKYLNGMYIEFSNVAPGDPSPISATRDRSYYEALEDVGYVGNLAYVRVPIILEPLFSSTGGSYNSNKFTVVAVTDPVSASKLSVIDGTSEFFTVALVHIPDINDPTQDIYAERVQLGLDYMFTLLVRYNIYSHSPCGDPDSNGNGFGLANRDYGYSTYVHGIMMFALVAAQVPYRSWRLWRAARGLPRAPTTQRQIWGTLALVGIVMFLLVLQWFARLFLGGLP